MIIPLVALSLVLSVPLTGGRLERLTTLRLRHVWLVALALVVQILITAVYVDEIPASLGNALHLATYGMAFVFFWANRHVPGLWVIGLGGAMNFAAISANGGTMPARPIAVALAGLALKEDFTNSGIVDDPELWFLGDIFALPSQMPFANVFSFGDVVLLVGLGVLLHRTCHDPANDPVVATGDEEPLAPAIP